MRHAKTGRKLGRDASHRRALYANLACSLIEHGRIRTTEAKAKAVKPYAERILGQFDMLKRFPVRLTAEDVEHGKPHPEIYLTAAARLTSCRAAGMLPLARNPAAFGSDLIPR